VITRDASRLARQLAQLYPVVTVMGPRQSGKTTLCRTCFAEHQYVSLEAPDHRQFATEDPRDFLAGLRDGAVLDEVQNVPELLSYLQGEVDRDSRPGRFVLTGSQHFALSQQISQSLAGRTGLVTLLPCSYDEVKRFDAPPRELWDAVWAGGYPRIHDRHIPANRWLSDYVGTYVQRDVRQVIHVGDLGAFTTFCRLAAGRTATELKLSQLGADAGVSHHTARSWLSVLETSFLVATVPAWHRSHRKQLIRSPKLHFIDSGLAAFLLGIAAADQLRHHPLRGALFETWVFSELYKSLAHRGHERRIFHFRDAKQLEVDLVIEAEGSVHLVECKSGATLAGDFFDALIKLRATVEAADATQSIQTWLVYGGDERQQRRTSTALPWDQVGQILPKPGGPR
jgi:predicted AAA+ superfamily ATPase